MAKTKSSYFDMAVQKGGQDFLDTKSPDEIAKDAKRRIFKDMAYGNIDYEKYGRYFMEPQFVGQLISVAEEEVSNHQIKYLALAEYDRNHPGDPRIIGLISVESRLYSAYSIILTHLQYVRDTGYNISILPNMTSAIYQFAPDLANNS